MAVAEAGSGVSAPVPVERPLPWSSPPTIRVFDEPEVSEASFTPSEPEEDGGGVVGWLSRKSKAAAGAITGGVREVAETAGQGVSVARQAAGNLYDAGRTGFSAVRRSRDAVVDEALEAGRGLFDRGRAGLSEVAPHIVPGAHGLELLGKGLNRAGEQAARGVDFLDRTSTSAPDLLRQPMGVAAGALGLVGSLAEGAGSLAEYSGRLAQGDRETVEGTLRTARGLGEAGLYVQGRGVERAGGLISGAGRAVGLEGVERIGEGVGRLGRAEQGLASPSTRQTVDTLGQATSHYSARWRGLKGEALRSLGSMSGVDALEAFGSRLADSAEEDARGTRNGLTEALDGAVADRVAEYRENGAYAVSRDLTQVVGEVAATVFVPGAGASRVSRLSRVTDSTLDAVRSTDRVSDAAGVVIPRFRTQRIDSHYWGEELADNPVWHNQGVRYLDATEREAYRLHVRDGRLVDAEGNLFDTSRGSSSHSLDNRAIFVMDEQGRFYASNHQEIGRFHHSSLVAGEPVAAAGELKVVNGQLTLLSNKSGHYRPSPELGEQALEVLREQGVDVSQVLREFIKG